MFNEIDKLTGGFQGFSIEPIKEESSILKISLKGNNVKKSADFLNKLTEVYLKRNLDQKNRVAENTIFFIDNQLGEISRFPELCRTNFTGFQGKQTGDESGFTG